MLSWTADNGPNGDTAGRGTRVIHLNTKTKRWRGAEMRRESDGEEGEKAKGILWKSRDMIAFSPSLRPPTSHRQWHWTHQGTQREWRTGTCPKWKGRKKDESTFSFVSGLLELTPHGKQDLNHALMRNVRSVSNFFFFYPFPLLWFVFSSSCVSAVNLQGCPSPPCWSLLPLIVQSEHTQTRNQQTRGEKENS